GDPIEGQRQKAVMEQWYELLEPISEDDIDEPDFELRAEELQRLQAERQEAQTEIFAEVTAIEANLTRHWPPYAELIADRAYWDEVSRIDLVRLLLVRVDDRPLALNAEGMLTDAAYLGLSSDHRPALAAFATQLLTPS